MVVEKYVKLELLNWQEETLYEIQGKITDSGTLTCDGASTVRSSCSFTFLLGNLYNKTILQEISNINKKFRLFIGTRVNKGDIDTQDITTGGDTVEPNTWTSVAPKLGAESSIKSLAVFNDKLYGVTTSNGNLLEWNGTNAWVQVAPNHSFDRNISSMAVFNGKIYGGTFLSGKLLEWNGTNKWVEVAPKFGSERDISSLAVFNNKLYGGTYGNGKLLEWNGTNAWIEVAPKLGSETEIRSLTVFNGKLYGGTVPRGKLYEWNGTNAWVEVAPQLGGQTYIYSLTVFNGKLYGGTYPSGKLFEWNGTNAWIEVAPKLGDESSILSLAVFNDKLYGGTGGNGKLLKWNGINAWIEAAPKLGDESSILSLAVFNDKLYGGTSPNGNLFKYNQDTSSGAGTSDIVWYNKGVLVFNDSPIVRQNAGQISVNITARDKMCLLDGTIAGKLPDPIVFHEIEERDLEGNIYYSEPTIYEIIIHLINKYGNEPYSNIIINDIPDYGRWLMEYRGTTPLWLHESGGSYRIQETSPGEFFKQYNAGDCIGYTLTKMTYPGELISSAGDTITSVLDKIKTVLGGNFEYYYDSDGHFIFQEKRNFINRIAIPNEIYNLTDNDYNIYTEDKEIVKSFNNNEIIISQSRTPSYSNIKNDFVVWGSKTAAGGTKIPIHYHLAIDDIPCAEGQDWRDLIYEGGQDGPYGYYYKELSTTYLQSDGSYITEWEKMYDTENKEWKSLVENSPSDLNYFLDFLDSGGVFGEYSVKKIGRRTEVLVDDEIGHIYNVTPDILFLRSSEEEVPGYTANFTMPDAFFETLTISSKGSSCYDAIRGLLYKHLLLHETISFSAVPDYSLEPNTKIEIFDKEMGIEGEYIINSISFPLNYNGLMNITASKVFKTI